MAPNLANFPTWLNSAGWVGWLFGALAVATFLLNRRKGQVEESAMLLSKWRELYDAHEARVKILITEIDDLRDRLTEAEKRILHLEKIVVEKDQAILEKDREIAGLHGQIRQITQSTVARLGENYMGSDVANAAHRTAEARRKKDNGDER